MLVGDLVSQALAALLTRESVSLVSKVLLAMVLMQDHILLVLQELVVVVMMQNLAFVACKPLVLMGNPASLVSLVPLLVLVFHQPLASAKVLEWLQRQQFPLLQHVLYHAAAMAEQEVAFLNRNNFITENTVV